MSRGNEVLKDAKSFSESLATSLENHPGIQTTDLHHAVEAAHAEGIPLHRVLIERGVVEEEALLPMLCEILGVEFVADVGVGAVQLDYEAIERLTAPFLRNRAAVPLLSSGDGPIPVLMSDPADNLLVEELAFLLDREVEPKGALLRSIRTLLSERGSETDRDAAPTIGTGKEEKSNDGPVIRFVNEKLAEAVSLGASDIHFEGQASGLSVRIRINGQLTPQSTDPNLVPASVFARLKVMANANVSERRMPQDARFSAVFSGRRIDFRLSSLPIQHGESIALRILDPQALRLGWERLGFEKGMVERVTNLIEKPSGLFLVTGPTGSGKTTTLYTALAHLNTNRRKIVTVEDPVEYSLPGIQQVQVQQEIGVTFAKVLRSILRHDPNVVMIGEIRDAETAEIACRAAQIGRMVLSTVHTRSANAARARLVDLGVPEYVVRDVLRGVLGQNLALVECPDCSGHGCRVCGFSGSATRKLELDLVELA